MVIVLLIVTFYDVAIFGRPMLTPRSLPTFRAFLHATVLLYLFQLGSTGAQQLLQAIWRTDVLDYWQQLWLAGAGSVGGVICGPLLYGQLVIPKILPKKRFVYPKLRPLLYMVSMTLSAMVLTSVLMRWNQSVPLPDSWLQHAQHIKQTMTRLLNFTSAKQGVGAFVCLACLPAVGEEWLFRGYLQSLLIRALPTRKFAVTLTALIFSLLHGNFTHVLPLFFLGLLFGYLQVSTYNLYYPILAHAFNNIGVLAWHVAHQYGWISSPHTNLPWPWLLAAGGTGLLSLFIWRRYFRSAYRMHLPYNCSV